MRRLAIAVITAAVLLGSAAVLGQDDGTRPEVTYQGPRDSLGLPNTRQGEKGVLTWPGVLRYEGEFSQGLPDGQGLLDWDGMHFEGEFSQGLPDGRGTLTFQNGDEITGFFSSSSPSEEVILLRDGKPNAVDMASSRSGMKSVLSPLAMDPESGRFASTGDTWKKMPEGWWDRALRAEGSLRIGKVLAIAAAVTEWLRTTDSRPCADAVMSLIERLAD